MNKDKLVIFDFDGVIADTFDMVLGINRQYVPDLGDDEYRGYFKGNIYESIKNNSHRFKGSDKHFEHYKEKILDQPIFDGMHELLIKLEGEYLTAVVSSSPRDLIELFLEAKVKIPVFKDILGTESGTSKHEKIGTLLNRYSVPSGKALMITDTVGDVLEARLAGVKSIGVSWGFNHKEWLEESKPFAVVDSASELEKCINGYFMV